MSKLLPSLPLVFITLLSLASDATAEKPKEKKPRQLLILVMGDQDKLYGEMVTEGTCDTTAQLLNFADVELRKQITAAGKEPSGPKMFVCRADF